MEFFITTPLSQIHAMRTFVYTAKTNSLNFFSKPEKSAKYHILHDAEKAAACRQNHYILRLHGYTPAMITYIL